MTFTSRSLFQLKYDSLKIINKYSKNKRYTINCASYIIIKYTLQGTENEERLSAGAQMLTFD
ncbi:hypothetical protein GCM10008931_26400 [Oceanobacillus oncorhynchi subsp. oncorhynchi]